MGIFNFFRKNKHINPKGQTHEDKIRIAYNFTYDSVKKNNFPDDIWKTIFPCHKYQANKIVISLAKIFSLNLQECDIVPYISIINIYLYIALRKQFSPHLKDAVAIDYLQTTFNDLIVSEEIAKQVMAFVKLNIVNSEFSLDDQECADSLDFYLKVTSTEETPMNKPQEFQIKDLEQEIIQQPQMAENIEGFPEYEYYFDGKEEFMAFIQEENITKNVLWLKGDCYTEWFQKGYQAFEGREFKKALALYTKSMEFNPVAINARLEMIECYIALALFHNAIKELNNIFKYLRKDIDIAHFYRRYGYIAVEFGKYSLAVACNKYSLNFEKNERAYQEIDYIYKIRPNIQEQNIYAEDELKKHNIPIIKTNCISN